MQIPIISGIYADTKPDMRTAYPVNLIPIPKMSGLSNGYLRPAPGLVANGSGPGICRGGINWNGNVYRVMGDRLVSIAQNGTVTDLGDVGGVAGQLCRMTYSFDRLAVASNGQLYYYSPTLGLVHVVDPDLGTALDVEWIDGYFVTTDGEYLVVTDLTDPTSVNPLKYGSAEIDPDPIKAVFRLRNELYAVNRHTIEVFDNVGGQFFPFQRIEGAQITKGAVGTHACCVFIDTIAFIGSGRNEALSVYLGVNSVANKISTREIDEILQEYTDEQLSAIHIESKIDKDMNQLLIHLPDKCLVYDAGASIQTGVPVWFILISSIVGTSQYRAKHHVWCYNRWNISDVETSSIGYLDDNISSHFGSHVRWEFTTSIIYNESRGAIFHELELVALPGYAVLGTDAYIETSYSIDGHTWSNPRSIHAGTTGNTKKRLVWLQQGHMRNWRIQRFTGNSYSPLSVVRLEAQIEPLGA